MIKNDIRKWLRYLEPVDVVQTSYTTRRHDVENDKSLLEVQVYGDRVRVIAIAQKISQAVVEEGLE